MSEYINLVKLCVGVDHLDDLVAWQRKRIAETGMTHPRHVTRMWPKQESALVSGGSLYWVIRGVIQARQLIVRLDEVIGEDGIRRCGIVLGSDLVRTEPVRKRPFQGWRYLKPADSPRDAPTATGSDQALPPELISALSEIGVR